MISTLGYGLFIWALGHGPMGAVSALREMSILFALLLGWLLLREQLTFRKIAAATIMLGGFLLIHQGR